jgi:two-component system response regulator ResD
MKRSTDPTAAPVQQRLFALLYEVRELLHRVLPDDAAALPTNVLRSGAIALNLDRLTVSDTGREVPLTSREVMVLRYLMQRPDRVVTREQLLTDVWGYSYTGDARTVAVHMSRLRRKLPSLRERLVAVKHLGYRLTSADSIERASA